jgi:hypothetical protein
MRVLRCWLEKHMNSLSVGLCLLNLTTHGMNIADRR